MNYSSQKLKLVENAAAIKALNAFIKKVFFSKYFTYWLECNRTGSRMGKKHAVWLSMKMNFPEEIFFGTSIEEMLADAKLIELVIDSGR